LVIELPARTYVPRYPQPEAIASAQTIALPQEIAPPEPPVAEPTHTSRRTVAMGVGVFAVAVAAVALLGGAGQGRGAQHDPDPSAHDLYARGRFLFDRQTEASLRESVDCFRQVIGRDPRFAAAYAGLADALDVLAQEGYMPPRESMEEARRAAQQALSLDAHLAEGYVALAAISEAYDWNFKKAESEYRRALALNPELPAAHLWYGMFLRDQGRLSEAMPELRRAEELEPMSVLATINLAHALHMAGNSDAAEEMANRAAELNPESPMADVLLANIYRSQSNMEDAEASLARALSLSTDNAHMLSALACTYARLGRRAEGVGLLHQMEELASQRDVSPFDLGHAALILGDEDRAANWLEEAYRERSTGMVFLVKEKSDSIQKSPRLQSLVKKIGRG